MNQPFLAPSYPNKSFTGIRDNPFPLKEHFPSTKLHHNFQYCRKNLI
uniref:Uncharacterized protein n=1 Tax=Rhizophora mucronata TaxID=61149 RepID=A0A2P2K6C7_RHIMU